MLYSWWILPCLNKELFYSILFYNWDVSMTVLAQFLHKFVFLTWKLIEKKHLREPSIAWSRPFQGSSPVSIYKDVLFCIRSSSFSEVSSDNTSCRVPLELLPLIFRRILSHVFSVGCNGKEKFKSNYMYNNNGRIEMKKWSSQIDFIYH